MSVKVKVLCSCLLVASILSAPCLFAQDTDVSLLKEKIITIQNMYPLGIQTLVACSKVTDYGLYEPLPDNKIKAGDVIFFYFEPQNPSTRKAEGRYEVWLSQDVVVLDAKQQEIYKKEGFIEIHYQTSSPRLDIYGADQLTFAEVPPGQYFFKAILHDKIKEEVASATWAFEVIE